MIQVYEEDLFDKSIKDNSLHLVYENATNGMKNALGDDISGPIHFSKGLTVLTWLKTCDGHPGKFTMEFVQTMNNCVGKGFGSRPCSDSWGLTFYAGTRCSTRAQPSPIEGPGIQKSCSYYRNTFQKLQFFQCYGEFGTKWQREQCIWHTLLTISISP